MSPKKKQFKKIKKQTNKIYKAKDEFK